MPSQSITLAKLTPPRLYAALPRERLFGLLDERRSHPVIWIAGPPGAGKTTLVASYLETQKLPAIWYQVDSGDGDAATFFYYLRQAALGLAGKKRVRLPLLTPEYLPDIAGFTRRWFRELFSRLPTPGIVVLDNYQEVAADSAFHRAIEAATNEIPDGANLIIISRTEPLAQFARLQASEHLAQVEWDDLRLTLDESRGIAAGQDQLSDEIIQALYEECGGWAAGFTLMRERARRTGRANRIDDAQTMETVFDYFATQIFDDAPAENRDILIRTAFLPRATVPMAEAISGTAQAGVLLDYLYRRHLFTSRRQGAEISYQFHALFRAFLLAQARRYYTPLGLAQLSHRAASLLEASGDPDEAVGLYLEAQDYGAVSELILKLAPDLLAKGRGQTLRDWIAALPEGTRESTPWLTYWAGTASIGIDLRKARTILEHAYEGLLCAADQIGQMMAAASVLETYYLELHDFNPTDRWVAVMEKLLGEKPSFPSLEAEAKVLGITVGAMFWRQPRHPLLPACLDRVRSLLQGDLEPTQKVDTACYLIWFYNLAGYAEQARQLIDLIEPEAKKPSVPPLHRALWLTQHAYYYVPVADPDQMQRTLDEALAIATENGFHFLLTLIYGGRGDLALELGDLATAAAIIEKKRAVLPLERNQALGRYHVLCAKLAIAKGDPDTALQHAEAAYAIALENGAAITKAYFGSNLVMILIERGDLDRAGAVLDEIRPIFPPDRYPYMGAKIQFPEACLAARQGNHVRCCKILRKALPDFRKAGLFSFGRLPMLNRRVCQLALHANIEVEYVQTVIRKNRIRAESPEIENWPWPVKVLTLGAFRVDLDGKPLISGRKVQRKPLELLKALVAFGGNAVSAESLFQALWPDAEGDIARGALGMALARLRKLLTHDDAIALSGNKLTLDPHCCWVDVWALERVFEQADTLQTDGSSLDVLESLTERILGLYAGDFLANETEQPWMLPLRDRLRARLLRHVLALGQQLEQTQRYGQAMALYQRGLEHDNLAEPVYRRLMFCHYRLGHQAEAMAVYRRCREMLSVVLGVKPAVETEKLYHDVRRG